MAASSASRSWARRALTTAAVAGVGLLALAIPASAHVPDAKAGCDKKISKPVVAVKLVAYQPKQGDKVNTVEIVEVAKDGKETSLAKEDFGIELIKTFVFDKLDGTVDHTFKVTVTALDDKDFKLGFSKIIKDLKSGICDKTEHPAPPPAQPPAQNPPAPQPAPAPAEVGAAGDLASTGVSIAIPLAIGGVLLAGGGALLLLMRRRSKA